MQTATSLIGNPETVTHEQSVFYKNPDNFRSQEGVCYAPAMFAIAYTYQDFLKLCQGNAKLAEYVFETIDGQHPQSLIHGELADLGVLPCESCEYLYNTEVHDYCPRCGWQTVKDF